MNAQQHWWMAMWKLYIVSWAMQVIATDFDLVSSLSKFNDLVLGCLFYVSYHDKLIHLKILTVSKLSFKFYLLCKSASSLFKRMHCYEKLYISFIIRMWMFQHFFWPCLSCHNLRGWSCWYWAVYFLLVFFHASVKVRAPYY